MLMPSSTMIRHAPSPINPLYGRGTQGYYRNAGSGGTPTPYGYNGYSPRRSYNNFFSMVPYGM